MSVGKITENCVMLRVSSSRLGSTRKFKVPDEVAAALRRARSRQTTIVVAGLNAEEDEDANAVSAGKRSN